MMRKIPIKTLACLVALIVLWAICSPFDFPAFADPYPRQIADVLAGTKTRCYVCELDLGFFNINREYLWKIDGDATSIAAVVKVLDVQEVVTAPVAFWNKRPYNWPRSLAPGMKCYKSSDFPDDGFGIDGDHFFMLTDTPNKRAYVWYKDCF